MTSPTPKLLVAIDTNVIVAASRSRWGASYALINSIPSQKFRVALSTSLYMEWRAHLSRPENLSGRSAEDALAFLRFLANQAHLQEIHFLLRPFLPDPKDDLVLELAFAARCRYILTYNLKDFARVEQFGVSVMTPQDFLDLMRDNA